MLNSHGPVLARGIEVPFEIWIILVICTGGIYLFVAIFRGDEVVASPARADEVDLGSLFADVVIAVMGDREEENLQLIWSKYSVSEDQRMQIVLMTKLALNEFFTAEDSSEETMGKIKQSLVSNGVPEGLASLLLVTIIRLMAANQTSRGQ